MNIIKENNGFPYAWRAGRVEKLIRSILEDKIKSQLRVNNPMIINTTWYHEVALEDQIKQANPDFIIAHNFADPAVPRVFDAIKSSGVPHIIIGNCDHIRLDFWAMVCGMFFKYYEIEELDLNRNSKKFICLNRKPHPHRVALVDNLKQLNLIDQGIVSLGLPGVGALIVDDRSKLSASDGIGDEMPSLAAGEEFISKDIANDIYSIGDIDNWRNALVNIVTETEFSNPNLNNFFISEKTWKPIIGCRPFVSYGQPHLREYLKQQGFDIFEDLIDYSIVNKHGYDPEQYIQYATAIDQMLKKILDPYAEFNNIKQRLYSNRQRYFQYVDEQWSKLINLNLNDHIK
jgi:hypothetical protein